MLLAEVEGSWGETDLTVSGFDLSIGERVSISENIANQMWDGIQNDSSLRSVVGAQQQGLVSSASVSGLESSLTGVTWMAMNSSIDSIAHWPVIGSQSDGIRYNDIREANQFSNTTYVAINRVLADELNLVAGDVFEFGWYVTMQLYCLSCPIKDREHQQELSHQHCLPIYKQHSHCKDLRGASTQSTTQSMILTMMLHILHRLSKIWSCCWMILFWLET